MVQNILSNMLLWHKGSVNMSRWIEFNPNPKRRRVGDCAIRACCKATNCS